MHDFHTTETTQLLARELITCELLCVRKRVTSFYSKRVCLYETVCACLCLCVIEGVYGSCCPWPDLFGKALIDVELPPHRVLSGHEDLAAGSTNPGALNSAIWDSHVFPSTSWEHSAPILSYSLSLCATGTMMLQSGTRDPTSLLL